MSNATTQIDTQAGSHPLPAATKTRWPPPQGQWTYQDWLRLPDDGWQYEIIRGVLYMVPAPPTTQLGQWGAGEAARSEVLERFEIEVDAILPSRA